MSVCVCGISSNCLQYVKDNQVSQSLAALTRTYILLMSSKIFLVAEICVYA